MKLKTLQFSLLLFAIIGALQISHASNWSWQNPKPTGEDITHSVKINASTAYFSTAKGNVFKTTDAGETWVMHTVKIGAEIDRLHFIDETNGFAASDSGLFKTTDAAVSWSKIEHNVGTLVDVWFFDASNAIAIGGTGDKIYKSTDGGVTWTKKDNPGSASYKYDVYFIDNNTGFVVGGNGTGWPDLLKTTDGGETWAQTSDQGSIHCIKFINSTTGFAVGAGGLLLKSTDTGDTWNIISLANTKNLYSIDFVDDQNGVAVGERYIYATTDGGSTWTETLDGGWSNTYKTVITFSSTKTVALGNNGISEVSKDVGATWETSTSLSNEINDILFTSSTTGYAALDNGPVIKTADKGATWEAVSDDVFKYAQTIFVEGDKILVGGSIGLLSLSENGGSTWTDVSSGSDGVYSIVKVSDNLMYAAGYGGKLKKSTNGGSSWTSASSPTTYNINDIKFIDESTGIFVGGDNSTTGSTNAAIIYKTTNGGSSWTEITSPVQQELHALSFIDATKVFAVGNNGTILQSTDGGESFTQITLTGFDYYEFNDIDFADANNGMIVGDYGIVLTTTDGGTTWTQDKTINSILDNTLNAVDMVYSTRAYVGGYGGSLLMYKTGADPTPAAPVAAFSADITSGDAPLKVTFTDESTNSPTSWSWDFNNDGTEDSKLQNPTYTFETAGKYTVSLKVTNDGGSNTETKTDYIVVTEAAPALKAAFTTDVTSGDAPLTVTFTDASTGSPTSWKWYIDDAAEPFAEIQSPIHEFATAGTFSVKLVVSDGTNTDDTVMTDLITVNAVTPELKASFTTDKTSGDAPLTISFTDASTGNPTSWSWYINDASEAFATTQNPSHEFTDAGTYSIKLVVSDGTNTDDTVMTDLITVNEVSETMNAAFSADVTTGEAPLTVSFTDESTGTVTGWIWEFGDGGTSTEQNPTYTYNTPGDYTVTLTVTDGMAGDNEQKVDYITVTEPAASCFDGTNFEMDFENDSDLEKWSLADMNEDGITWGRFNSAGVNSSKCLGYQASSTDNADDYLISPCIDLEAGKTYKFSFEYATSGSNESVQVYYGRSSEFGLEDLLESYVDINNTTFQTASFNLSITESNSYSFTWYIGSAANSGNFYFDNFKVQESDGTAIFNESISELNVYPNPTQGMVNISVENNGQPTMLSIYNTSGMMVMQKEISSFSSIVQIDLSKLNKGLYILKTTSNGSNKVARITVN